MRPKDNLALASVQVKVTINRPHTRYDPEIAELTVSTHHYSMTEPERICFEFSATSGTGVGGHVVGFIDSNSTDIQLKVPTGKVLTVLRADGICNTGTTNGTYTTSIIIRNLTNSVNIDCATQSVTVTGGAKTRNNMNAQGTRITPLATLAAGKEFMIGWRNHATSVAALSPAPHHVRLTCIYEDA